MGSARGAGWPGLALGSRGGGSSEMAAGAAMGSAPASSPSLGPRNAHASLPGIVMAFLTVAVGFATVVLGGYAVARLVGATTSGSGGGRAAEATE